jgi:hypothetical protein
MGQPVRRALSLPVIVSFIFFNVSDEPYALEDMLASGAAFEMSMKFGVLKKGI